MRCASSSLKGGADPGAPASLSPASLSCHVSTPLAGSKGSPAVPLCRPSPASSALTLASCSASRRSFSFGRCLGFFVGLLCSPLCFLLCPCFWPLHPSGGSCAKAERRRDVSAPEWGPLSLPEDRRERLRRTTAEGKEGSVVKGGRRVWLSLCLTVGGSETNAQE